MRQASGWQPQAPKAAERSVSIVANSVSRSKIPIAKVTRSAVLMSDYQSLMSRYHYEVPAEESAFEELVCDILNAVHDTTSFQLYRGRGSNQYGVDIFSKKMGMIVQCKKKDSGRKDLDLRRELVADLEETVCKARGWPHQFTTLVFATTTKKYSAIQDRAIELSDKERADVQFLAWAEIEKHIHRFRAIRERFYPHLAPAGRATETTVIARLPIPKTIGANGLMKSTIIEKFNRLGVEREKRFGKSAYAVMYKNFQREMKLGKNQKWTVIWDWPESAAKAICDYLDGKWKNTIAGRRESAKTKPNYIPNRPQLFAKEKEWLAVLGLEIESDETRHLLERAFGVTSHRSINHLQHWLFVLQLEQIVKDRVGI